MQFPKHVYELRPEHYAIAGIPIYSHTEWDGYAQIPPAGALCAAVGRVNRGEIEFFVGDGVHPYPALSKVGASEVTDAIASGVTTLAPSQNAVHAALALKADADKVALIKAVEAASRTSFEDVFNGYNPTGISRGSINTYEIEATVPKDGMFGGASIVVGGMSLVNEISESVEEWVGTDCVMPNVKAGDIISNVGSGDSAIVQMHQETTVEWEANITFYVRAKFRVTNDVCASVEVTLNGGDSTVLTTLQSTPTEDEWYTVSKVISIPTGAAETKVVIGFQHNYADGTGADGSTLEVDLSELMVINLSGVGLQAFSAPECDALVVAGAFGGAMNTVAMSLKSTDSNGGNAGYFYHKPVTLRRFADGTRDTIESGILIRRVKEDGSGKLAEPIILPGYGAGILALYPGGKIRRVPALRDVAIYTSTGLVISRVDFPIKEIESIKLIDSDTGTLTALDIAETVVAEDGLSLLHPNLVEGDAVELVYIWDYHGPIGQNTYSYLKDPLVGFDSSNSKYYRAVPTFDNGGALAWTASEVF